MGSSYRKIYVDSGKYIFHYQFKFLKNIIKKDKTFTSGEMKEYLDKFVIYNMISDLEEQYGDSASLVWLDEVDTVAFQFPEDGKIVEALSKEGFEFPELDEDYW
tara:strand:- start:1313 stop:1624 length:312 start_codon:yes stop_codon:yes gene_type:complete